MKQEQQQTEEDFIECAGVKRHLSVLQSVSLTVDAGKDPSIRGDRCFENRGDGLFHIAKKRL
jgi:hypothetical protein